MTFSVCPSSCAVQTSVWGDPLRRNQQNRFLLPEHGRDQVQPWLLAKIGELHREMQRKWSVDPITSTMFENHLP